MRVWMTEHEDGEPELPMQFMILCLLILHHALSKDCGFFMEDTMYHSFFLIIYHGT